MSEMPVYGVQGGDTDRDLKVKEESAGENQLRNGPKPCKAGWLSGKAAGRCRWNWEGGQRPGEGRTLVEES